MRVLESPDHAVRPPEFYRMTVYKLERCAHGGAVISGLKGVGLAAAAASFNDIGGILGHLLP